MLHLPTALLASAPQVSSPASAGRVRRSNRADGQFPPRRWARLVNRVWARVQAELVAEAAQIAVQVLTTVPAPVLPTEHRRPIAVEPEVADPRRAQRMRERAGGLVARELAAQRQEAKRTETARVAVLGAHDRRADQERLAAKVGILQSDRGADGQAMQQRPSISAEGGARVVVDHDPLVALPLTERQAEAAGWLREYWRDALPGMDRPRGWGSGGRATKVELTGDQERAVAAAWKNYVRWMQLIRRDCGDQAASAVWALVIMCEPHPAAALVPSALEYLAAHMGIAGSAA